MPKVAFGELPNAAALTRTEFFDRAVRSLLQRNSAMSTTGTSPDENYEVSVIQLVDQEAREHTLYTATHKPSLILATGLRMAKPTEQLGQWAGSAALGSPGTREYKLRSDWTRIQIEEFMEGGLGEVRFLFNGSEDEGQQAVMATLHTDLTGLQDCDIKAPGEIDTSAAAWAFNFYN